MEDKEAAAPLVWKRFIRLGTMSLRGINPRMQNSLKTVFYSWINAAQGQTFSVVQ